MINQLQPTDAFSLRLNKHPPPVEQTGAAGAITHQPTDHTTRCADIVTHMKSTRTHKLRNVRNHTFAGSPAEAGPHMPAGSDPPPPPVPLPAFWLSVAQSFL